MTTPPPAPADQGRSAHLITRLVTISLSTVLVVVGCFGLVLWTQTQMRSFLGTDVGRNVGVIRANSELGRRMATIESSIQGLMEHLRDDPESFQQESRMILAELDVLRGTALERPRSALDDDLRQSIDRYRASLSQRLDHLLRMSLAARRLETDAEVFVVKINAMEDATGKAMVRDAMAGLDTTGLAQTYALIPFCREQLFRVRILVDRSLSRFDPAALEGPASEPEADTARAALAAVRRTLNTLTSASPEVGGRAGSLLNAVERLGAQLRDLRGLIVEHRRLDAEFSAVRETFVSALHRTDRQTAETVEELQRANAHLILRSNAGLFAGLVVMFGASVVGMTLVRRLGKKMASAVAEAEEARRAVEEKNNELMKEVAERQQVEAEQAVLRARLQQAQKMEAIGTLAGGIAHDFNNILHAIIGFSELALEGLLPGAPGRKEIETVLGAGLRAADLTQQILTFSRKSPRTRAPLKLRPIVAECAKLLKATLPSTIGVVTLFDPRCEEALIVGDHTQLHQVLMNLGTNAFHAMREQGGTLTVSVSGVQVERDGALRVAPELQTGSYVELAVADTGHGIEPALLERIFEPYFTTKERGAGTGLGLSVVQGIVESMGGRIAVSSQVGKGTTFRVFFPQAQTPAAEAPAEEPAGAWQGGRERILFVDDEENIAALQKEALSRLGYEVTATTSSPEALRLVETDSRGFDLIITDMTMPKLTGDALARKILALRPSARLILCTGYSERLDEARAKELGFRAYLSKPVSGRDMARAIRSVLDAG